MLRLAAFAVTSALATAVAGPLPPLPLGGLLTKAAPDRLAITMADTGNRQLDREYRLECDPVGGDHPQREQACARLDQLASEGRDPFAPVSKRQLCTMQHGGPATARITGTWRGHKVDATFRRTDGCEISRWDELEPLLPSGRS
ncbi:MULTISPECIES: SSI family serine proteinase inhibitor [Streptomyces]|uniref:SSI family serine proteinase inhibitor n=1 Tax=Streptomyces TaxID=1883 RepID=UPI0022722379|nr:MULTISPECIES: SSI family serine proteinase inhibitor [unclassified Streptomyces]MCY0944664.1 SSI family serine proteinase inhibitor [Streptomyces sp. H34-AA3]MCY0951665.1 SSI family serine proteinase inhibitor [Streptomyces sp. H27-S2]MCZ4086117.1 SSI family serine proteinase inhibitor [Streptomyces sp. H34-S5]